MKTRIDQRPGIGAWCWGWRLLFVFLVLNFLATVGALLNGHSQRSAA